MTTAHEVTLKRRGQPYGLLPPIVAALTAAGARLHPWADTAALTTAATGLYAATFGITMLDWMAQRRIRRAVAYAAALAIAVILALPRSDARSVLSTPLIAMIFLVPVLVHVAWGIWGAARLRPPPGQSFKVRCTEVLAQFIPTRIAALAASELLVLGYAVSWRRPATPPAGVFAATYHRGLRPILWALLFVSILEIAVAHLLVATLWSPRAALFISLFSELMVVYFVGVIRSLDRLPILVAPEGIRIRTGLLLDLWLPWDAIADVRTVLDAGRTKRRGFLRASLIAYPNALISLRHPAVVGGLGRGRAIDTIGLRPDDGPALVQAMRAAKECAETGPPGRAVASLCREH